MTTKPLTPRETAIIKSYKAEVVAYSDFAVALHYPDTRVAEKYEVRLRRVNHLQHVDRFVHEQDAVTMMSQLSVG